MITQLIQKIDHELVDKLIADGYITKRPHHRWELFIYDYTAKTQYDNYWTNETMQLRGMITDKEGNIIARPFPKFFNIEQYKEANTLPDETFRVYDKLDGSLGILYFYEDKPYISTRGAFDSPQALKATEMLYDKYLDIIPQLDQTYTYLFEIIYPENRIVVDYGQQESLILLDILDTKTGKSMEHKVISGIGYAPVWLHDMDISNLPIRDNEEGYVIRFESGLRIKYKFPEYVKLHAIISQMTAKKIWERVKNNILCDENLLSKIPDELYIWMSETEKQFNDEYKAIRSEARAEFNKNIPKELRKELAVIFKGHKYEDILFRMLNGRDYSDAIWDRLRPKHEIPVIKGLAFYEQGNKEQLEETKEC